MSRNNDAPFGRGETGYMGATPTAPLRFTDLLGMTKEFEDINANDTDSARSLLSPRRVKCVLVRNESGGALLPGQVVTFAATAPYQITNATATADLPNVGVVDEYLPAAGVADDDVFWLVIEGPCDTLVVSSGTTAAGSIFSSSATSGRAGAQGTPADATAARNYSQAVLGYSMESAANGNSQIRLMIWGNAYRGMN